MNFNPILFLFQLKNNFPNLFWMPMDLKDQIWNLSLPENSLNSISGNHNVEITYFTFAIFNKIFREINFSDDNAESDHVDYKKALDLVEYIAPLSGNLTDVEAEKEAIR